MNENIFPSKVMFGHAYVPNQILVNVLPTNEALKSGSLFPELISSYIPGQSMEVIDYLKNSGGGMDNGKYRM